MKYCLSIGIHNLFFDIAIVNDCHEIVEEHKCDYDRSKDIASNIYLAYQKYFSKYKIVYIGVGISNNIEFKEGLIYKIKTFNINRYDLKQALYKLFKCEVYVLDETYLASLSLSCSINSDSLLYVLLDNKISNSFVINHELIELEDDIDLKQVKEINEKCSKDALKTKFLKHNFDDDYIGTYFLSLNEECKEIIKEWAVILNKYLAKLINQLNVKQIAFSGSIGEFSDYFKDYLDISKKVKCFSVDDHRKQTLIGVSHLIFKDNS